jgi:hypothetical protein
MKIVKWSFGTESIEPDIKHPPCMIPLIDKDYYPFVSLAKEVKTLRRGEAFLKCPANTDFLKNTFGLVAPHDLVMEIHSTADNQFSVRCENLLQDQFNKLVDTRFLEGTEKGTSPHPLVGLDWLCTFTSEEPMLVQLLPAFLHHNDFTLRTVMIPGQYDISKWVRPVELVFEFKRPNERVTIKKGDVVAYFKFYTDNVVKLIEQPVPWDDTMTCMDIRNKDRWRPLKARYEAFAKVKSSKCPYSPKD